MADEFALFMSEINSLSAPAAPAPPKKQVISRAPTKRSKITIIKPPVRSKPKPVQTKQQQSAAMLSQIAAASERIRRALPRPPSAPAPPSHPPPMPVVAAPVPTSHLSEREQQQSAYNYDKEQQKKQQVAKSGFGKGKKRKMRWYRGSAGHVWEDKTLMDWPENDFRIFVGDLGNEVTDDLLASTFRDSDEFKSFAMARILRDKRSKKSRGFGFVSFLDPNDMVKALRTMNGKYCGNRPMKLRKSNWAKRNLSTTKGRKMSRKKHLTVFDKL